jgi:PAS domain S-box-containing protein
MEFSRFVVIKQAAVGYIILLLADVLLHLGQPRKFFGLQEDSNNSKSVHVISMALLLGVFFWIVDSIMDSVVFLSGSSFLDSLAMNIPPHNVFVRIFFLLVCLAGGLLVSKHLSRQRKSDSALRESERKYRNLLENQSEAVFRISLSDGKFDYISPAVSEIFGYSLNEILETPLFIMGITHPEFKASMEQYWHDIVNGEVAPSFEYKVINADGQERWIFQSNNAVYDKNGQIIALEGICRDVTEQKRTEEERELLLKRIHEQALQMQQTIDTVPEGMILLNEDYKVILANPAAAEFMRLLSDSTVGETLEKLGNRSLTELLNSPATGFWHEVMHDNRYFEVISRLMERYPGPQGWVMVIREVTQEREIHKRIQQQEQLAAVGQLAAGIAHDFNNIMAVIVLSTEMGLLSSDVPSDIRENLTTISGQADRAAELIQQLLDFGRRAVLELLPMDLLPFFKEQIKLLERTLPENIGLKLNYGTDRYWVNADPTRLQQIVLNLAVNARDAMPDGGELNFEMTIHKGEWVHITVSDTGNGISSDILEHVFEPFFTTKSPGKGTGLGLAQVFGIVNQHEGHIEVTSAEGEGTSFYIRLPLLREHCTDKSKSNMEERPDIIKGNNEVILVVEDDKVVRKTLV